MSGNERSVLISLPDTYGAIINWVRYFHSVWLTRGQEFHRQISYQDQKRDQDLIFGCLVSVVYSKVVASSMLGQQRESVLDHAQEELGLLHATLGKYTQDEFAIDRFVSAMELSVISETTAIFPTIGSGIEIANINIMAAPDVLLHLTPSVDYSPDRVVA